MTYTPAQYAAVLASAAVRAAPEARKVVEKGALEIKKRARSTAGSSNRGKAAAIQHINYDMRGQWEAEIGYDKMAGSLGTMLEYGSAGNTPNHDLGRALEAEAPTVGKFLAEVAEECL